MPSPLEFDIINVEASSGRETVKGYCNKRKDSLAIYKDDGGAWHIIHKATGTNVNVLRPDRVKKYPALLDFMAFLQQEAASELAVIDAMPFHPAKKSDEQVAALTRLRQIAQRHS